MRTFEYRGFGADGHHARGLVDALSAKEARDKLARTGIFAERLWPARRPLRCSTEQRATLYRELSSLLAAGLPLAKALDAIVSAPDLNALALVAAGMRDDIREGKSLADSMAGASPSVTEFELAIVEAAERSGALAPMLDELASFLEEQTVLKDKVQNALIYPVFVVTLGICAGIVMLGLLLPRTRALMSGINISEPALTRFMRGLGAFLGRWGAPFILLLSASAVWLARRLRLDPEFRVRCERHLFRAPWIGRGYTLLINVRFASTLSVLLRGGVGLVDAIPLAGRATGSRWVAILARREAESVRHGSRLSDAIRRIPPLAEQLSGWIQTGEAGGEMTRLLDAASARHRQHWERFVSRSLSVLEPILILLIGGFVLLVTLSVLLPLLSLSQAVAPR